MSQIESIMSPAEFRQKREVFEGIQEAPALVSLQMQEKIHEFNELLEIHTQSYQTEFYLEMNKWGHDWDDIKFIVKAGYHVSRHAKALAWEIALP